MFALIISLGQATVYVLTGLYGQPKDLGAGVCLLLIVQLICSALIVILLDELEKAHKDVAMILLQILDEGSITDSQGRKVDFKNTIICLTSNLGSDILAHKTASDEQGVVTAAARDEVLERTSEYFPPELLNRLDAMLVFNKLSRESVLQVVDLRLKDVSERLAHRRIRIDVDQGARDWLASKGYSDVYGARAIARVVRTEVLFPLAQKLLRGTIR